MMPIKRQRMKTPPKGKPSRRPPSQDQISTNQRAPVVPISPSDTSASVRGRPFQPGNTYGRGRPPGSRNRNRVCQDTLERFAENITKKCVIMATQGNPTALRLCMERLQPARRHRTLHFELPPIKTMADVEAASTLVIRWVARGRLTPAEGQSFFLMLEGRRRVIESQELEPRVRALEDRDNTSQPKRWRSSVGPRKL